IEPRRGDIIHAFLFVPLHYLNPKTLIVICGPTAVGKTKAAIELAKQLDTAVVSADSRQVYREMKTGTARPDESELQGIKHYLLGHISIEEDYNAGKFEADALKALDEIFKKNDYAILCGGTGLYINAVLYGFDELPEKDEKLRAFIETEYEKNGLPWLQEKLKELDPIFYEKAELKNPQRMMRAVEVCMSSGKTHAELKSQEKIKKTRPFTVIKTGLNTDRDELYTRIHQRVDEMMEKGLLEEARSLHPKKHLNALQTVGYTELFDYFEGKTSLERAVELIKQNTRHYAKRQITWFKRDEEIRWFSTGEIMDLRFQV
ncbi:MAG: tRNA (adenosine(37)-N6)-dimethylallyltransferase MiaA, partial [Bacteroidota bacterium]